VLPIDPSPDFNPEECIIMSWHNHSPGRPPTLVERLQRLNDSLAGLGRRLRDSVATVVGSAVAEAVRDGVRRLLEQVNPTPTLKENETQRRDHLHQSDRLDDDRFDSGGYYREPGGWPREQGSDFPEDEQTDGGLWRERYESEPPTREPETNNRQVGRLEYAVTTAVAAGTWWVQRNRLRRPVLTTVAVAVAAGIAAFFAGPAVAAGLSVLSAVGGMVLTADALTAAATGLAGFVGG
jgi:hypothetical protein